LIIDIHTHVPAEAEWPLFLRHCRDNQVTLAITSALGSWSPFPDRADVRAANELACRFAAFANGMVRWFAYLNPQNDSWEEELDRCVAEGACGVKLWISLKDPDSGSLDSVPPVLRAAGERGLPVLIHTYQRTDDNLPGEVTVAEFAELARGCPDVILIAAHSGGNWRQCLGLLRDVPNTVVDLCGGYPETGMAEALVADLGADRVLYGSDALGRSFASQIIKVTFADLSREDQERILWRNSARLLGLDDADLQHADAAASALAESPSADMPEWREDHFCFCGQWPFRSNPCASSTALETALGEAGIERAFVADAAAVFAFDVLAANRAFVASASACRRLVPLAAMVPFAPNWKSILGEAAEHFAGGIIYPFLHNWCLNEPQYEPFFETCAAFGFPLWINVATGDIRFRHRGTVCRDVSATELVGFLTTAPENDYVIQGASAALVRTCLEESPRIPRIRFDLSRLSDNSTALLEVVRDFGWERLVLGTEFPFRDLRAVRYTAATLSRA